MTLIQRTDTNICCEGHAGDKVCCAMLTALSVSLVENLTERIDSDVEYTLESGYFNININGLSNDAMFLIEAYWYSLVSLSNSYPANFSVIRRGSD